MSPSPAFDLAGKTAIVTGAASGVGLGIARAFARAGMRLVLADIQDEALQDALAQVRALGAEAIAVVADVSRDDHEVEQHVTDVRQSPPEVLCRVDDPVMSPAVAREVRVAQMQDAQTAHVHTLPEGNDITPAAASPAAAPERIRRS